MPSLSSEAVQLLVAVYFEQEFVGSFDVAVDFLAGSYGIGDRGTEILVSDLLNEGAITASIFQAEGKRVTLTPHGRSLARSAVRDGVRARKLTSFSDGTTFSDGTRFSSMVPNLEDQPIRHSASVLSEGGRSVGLVIDSAAWTGLTRIRIDGRNAAQVSNLLDRALSELVAAGGSNVDTMQAAAYLRAAKELVEAPDPPTELIWQLIGKAADVVGLLAFFYTLFASAVS